MATHSARVPQRAMTVFRDSVSPFCRAGSTSLVMRPLKMCSPEQ